MVAGPLPDPDQLDDLTPNLASERDLLVGEPTGERGEHVQELPTLDSAVPKMSLQVTNLINLSAL